jgi:hypothetical protein
LSFPGIAGIAFDSAGDVFVSYDSTTLFSGQQQSVAEVSSSGYLISSSVFGTSGSAAVPGALTAVGSSDLPNIGSTSAILEMQPDGQLFVFDPVGGTSSQYDNLPNDRLNASTVFDVQTGAPVNLSGQIGLANATFGDFGVNGSSLVVSAESNNWDFVMRVTYGASGGSATVLAASPASDGLSASPGGVAVDPQGTVLATLPYLPTGSSTAIHVPVGFSLFYDTESNPSPKVLNLGLTTVPDIDSGGITVDSQSNFLLALSTSSLYGGGPGIAHVNSALTAFLADPVTQRGASPTGITYQSVGGKDYLAFTNPSSGTYTVAGELPLFSGQVSPAQLRHAYGIDQIQFTAPGGTTVSGDGTGQTIAVVEEGVDPTIAADLTTFDQFFGIPAPPSFQVVDQNGVTTQNLDIVGEASLDVEWAHLVAPGASIVVYNAAYIPTDPNASFVNLMSAMHQASMLPGVSVVSLSYGEAETSLASSGLSQQSFDSEFTTPGVTFVAASGDTGIYGNGGYQVTADYPAASPNILAVGGTSIVIDQAGDYPGTGPSGEVAWGNGINSGNAGGGGGGLSSIESQPAWQIGVVPSSVDPVGARALPDVAMDSGSAQQYDVFTSTLSGSSVSAAAVGWLGDAGTSAAAPIWAGLIAIANQGRVLAGGTPLTGNTQTMPALYSLPAADFHDVLYGNNGDAAGPGYDLTSGRGTPSANLLVPDLAGYQIPSQLSIESQPPANVGTGGTFGLKVQVRDRLGNPVSGGSVTVALANNPGHATLGGTLSMPVANGLATFSGLSIDQPDAGYTLSVTGSGNAGTLTTTPITVTAGSNSTRLTVSPSPVAPVFGQAVTLSATVGVSRPGSGMPTGTVTFKEGPTTLGTATLSAGVAQVTFTPSSAGTHTITITYGGDPNDQPSSTSFSLTVNQATPTLSWASPADIVAGTSLGSAQLDAVVAFGGRPVPGLFTYTPGPGTVLSAGSGQVLSVLFTPSDTVDFKVVTSSVLINVIPRYVPPAAVVIGEQPLFQRKLRRGKPVGPAILTGFRLEFSGPLGATAAANPRSYVLSAVTTRRIRSKVTRLLQPIAGFSVSYTASSDSVTLRLLGGQTFPAGGQLKVLPGVTAGAGSVLSGTAVFTITAGGRALLPS